MKRNYFLLALIPLIFCGCHNNDYSSIGSNQCVVRAKVYPFCKIDLISTEIDKDSFYKYKDTAEKNANKVYINNSISSSASLYAGAKIIAGNPNLNTKGIRYYYVETVKSKVPFNFLANAALTDIDIYGSLIMSKNNDMNIYNNLTIIYLKKGTKYSDAIDICSKEYSEKVNDAIQSINSTN